VALLTLALGIGGVATIFTLYDQVLLRPLPYEESEDLVEMWERLAAFENAAVSYPNFTDWRERNRVFEDLAAWNDGSANVTGSGDPREIDVIRTSASAFPIMRVTTVLGRVFSPDEDRVGAPGVVVLSHSYWRDQMGGDPDAVGRTLTFDGLPFTVVGVMPEGFAFPSRDVQVDAYVPIGQYAEDWMQNRGSHPGILVLGRLLPDVDLDSARQDMERVARELEAEFPETNEGSGVNVAPLQERVARGAVEPLRLLLLAVGFLLLIACINVANLVLARSTSRTREMAVRTSLGAGRSRIVRLLVTETLVLWILGGLLGTLLAMAGVKKIAGLLASQIPSVIVPDLDGRVVLAILGLSLVTGLLFGLPPALRVVRKDLREFLKEGTRTTGGVGRSRFRSGLVVAEVGLALGLLAGAGLTLRSYSNIAATSPGLDPANVLAVEVNLPESRYPEIPSRTAFFTQLLDAVRAVPGVVSAATSYNVPLGPGGWQNGYHAEGDPPEQGGDQAFAETNAVSTDYFEAMGIPLLRGREFTREDGPDAPSVAIVGENFAERHWPGEDPIGKRLKWGTFDSENPWIEVVGVVGHVKVNGVVNEALPQIYLPHWQDNDLGYYVIIKTRGDPLAVSESVRQEVLALDPSQPLASVQTLTAYARETTRDAKLLALLMAVFSVAAVLLAAVGIYGVMSQMTSERKHEIGIRMALGAREDQVLSLVFRQGLIIVAVGVTLGLGLAIAVGRLMASQLFGITPADPVTLLIAPLVVTGVAMAANLVPARRAMRVDPVRALQAD
jgi:predicted permease